MNMFWILILVIYMVWPWNNNKNQRNLIYISTQTSAQSTVKSPMCYMRDQLFAIRDRVKHDKVRVIPNYHALRTIKDLKINRKRIRLQKQDKKEQRKINLNNLKHLEELKHDWTYTTTKFLNIATVNARSMRNKVTDIQHLLLDHDLDVLGITESWITESDDDICWMDAQGFNNINYQCILKQRPNQR